MGFSDSSSDELDTTPLDEELDAEDVEVFELTPDNIANVEDEELRTILTKIMDSVLDALDGHEDFALDGFSLTDEDESELTEPF